MVMVQTAPSVYGAVLPLLAVVLVTVLVLEVVGLLVCAEQSPAVISNKTAIGNIFVFIMRAA